jgi:hypothetical protein
MSKPLPMFTRAALAATAAAFVLAPTHSLAQTKKPAAVKVAKASPSSMRKAAPAAAAAAAVAAPAALSSEQLSIAQIVHTGNIKCELGQSITVTPDAKTQGAFDVSYAGRRYAVVPVPTKTGAVRLENAREGIVYMQLANKSMLLNEKQGRRMADECASPEQQAVAAQLKASNAPNVLEAPSK